MRRLAEKECSLVLLPPMLRLQCYVVLLTVENLVDEFRVIVEQGEALL